MTTSWITDTITPDLRRALRFTLLWGLDAVVIRSVGSARVPDLNESQLRIRLQSEDVRIAAVDPGLFEISANEPAVWRDDIQQLSQVTAFCRRFDCPMVLTGGLPSSGYIQSADIFKRTADQLDDVCLAVRSSDRESDEDLGRMLKAVDDIRITACWDPANTVVSYASPIDSLGVLRDRLGAVIVRDVDASGNRADFGEGVVPWSEILRQLVMSGYDGLLIMDLSGAAPRGALRSATSLLYMLREVRKTL